MATVSAEDGRACTRCEALDVVTAAVRAVDERGLDALPRLYTADVTYHATAAGTTLVGPLEGLPALIAHFVAMRDRERERGSGDIRTHVVSGTRLEAGPRGEMTATSDLLIVSRDAHGHQSVVGAGTYHDELREDAGQLRIARRVIAMAGDYTVAPKTTGSSTTGSSTTGSSEES